MSLVKQPGVIDSFLGEQKERNGRNEWPRERFNQQQPMGHNKSEKWITWIEYASVQSSRIFAEAAAARKASAGEDLAIESLPKSVTPFQRAFFEQLSALPAASEQELVRQAQAQGIPNECATAYWRARHYCQLPAQSKPLKLSKLANDGEEAP